MKIKDIGNVVTGKTPQTAHAEFYGGDYMFITPTELHGGYKISSSEKTLTEAGLESIKTNSIDGISVLVGCIGWDMGNVAMCFEKCATNQQINSITQISEDYSPYFLYYWLSTKKEYLFSISSVTRTPILSKGVFEEIEIPSISRSEQDKIAKVLLVLDKKIKLNSEVNDNLAQQAQLLFDFMFQDISGSKHIGDFIVPQRGTALLSKDAIPGDIPVVAGGLVPSTYHNAANTVAPVITISSSGANAGFVNLWGVPVWSSDSSFIDFKMTPYVYFWHALLKRHQNNIYKIQTGSAQPHIYPSHIASLPVCDLDFGKVADYTERVTPLFTLISKNYKESNQLRALRDWLLPMLMNGQATISDSAAKLSFTGENDYG